MNRKRKHHDLEGTNLDPPVRRNFNPSVSEINTNIRLGIVRDFTKLVSLESSPQIDKPLLKKFQEEFSSILHPKTNNDCLNILGKTIGLDQIAPEYQNIQQFSRSALTMDDRTDSNIQP
jgi:hypothetical protein